jgi:bidirectional [NiFe] hydrogenase diaphorase subunit
MAKKFRLRRATTLLEAAQKANILIPQLCSNEELAPYGACRLCVVEITHKNRTRIVASCIYEVAEGLEVNTRSERVLNVRKLVIELLLGQKSQTSQSAENCRGSRCEKKPV